jgi:hypothetical protein
MFERDDGNCNRSRISLWRGNRIMEARSLMIKPTSQLFLLRLRAELVRAGGYSPPYCWLRSC